MMLIKLLLIALVLALCLAAIEFVLLLTLVRQLPRWRWRLLCLRYHAWPTHLSYRMRLMRERVQCHMHPSRAYQDTREQTRWTWAEIEDVIRAALAMDITILCRTVQEVEVAA
jgi:hypothetical protein